jgi:hypothetical protein
MQAREATRTARTLSTLTETLSKLQRMRYASGGEAASRNAAEAEEPVNIHEMRRELARRIAALSAAHQEQQQEQNDALQNALWPD